MKSEVRNMLYVDCLEDKLSVREVAKLLGVSRNYVLGLIRKNILFAIRVSKCKQYLRRDDVEAYLIKLNEGTPIPAPVPKYVSQQRAIQKAIREGEKAMAPHLKNRNKKPGRPKGSQSGSAKR